ncbi:MAG: hypothetical protein M1827_005081 [Pycnora praestabilis]|nr:MAG: hypothetical protein M1827_005081 [Pycnora praestabilis]
MGTYRRPSVTDETEEDAIEVAKSLEQLRLDQRARSVIFGTYPREEALIIQGANRLECIRRSLTTKYWGYDRGLVLDVKERDYAAKGSGSSIKDSLFPSSSLPRRFTSLGWIDFVAILPLEEDLLPGPFYKILPRRRPHGTDNPEVAEEERTRKSIILGAKMTINEKDLEIVPLGEVDNPDDFAEHTVEIFDFRKRRDSNDPEWQENLRTFIQKTKMTVDAYELLHAQQPITESTQKAAVEQLNMDFATYDAERENKDWWKILVIKKNEEKLQKAEEGKGPRLLTQRGNGKDIKSFTQTSDVADRKGKEKVHDLAKVRDSESDLENRLVEGAPALKSDSAEKKKNTKSGKKKHKKKKKQGLGDASGSAIMEGPTNQMPADEPISKQTDTKDAEGSHHHVISVDGDDLRLEIVDKNPTEASVIETEFTKTELAVPDVDEAELTKVEVMMPDFRKAESANAEVTGSDVHGAELTKAEGMDAYVNEAKFESQYNIGKSKKDASELEENVATAAAEEFSSFQAPEKKTPNKQKRGKCTKGNSKSMTQADLQAISPDVDHSAAVERLKNETSLPTLEEARDRRLSVRKGRSDSIKFLEERTRSRASSDVQPQPSETARTTRDNKWNTVVTSHPKKSVSGLLGGSPENSRAGRKKAHRNTKKIATTGFKLQDADFPALPSNNGAAPHAPGARVDKAVKVEKLAKVRKVDEMGKVGKVEEVEEEEEAEKAVNMDEGEMKEVDEVEGVALEDVADEAATGPEGEHDGVSSASDISRADPLHSDHLEGARLQLARAFEEQGIRLHFFDQLEWQCALGSCSKTIQDAREVTSETEGNTTVMCNGCGPFSKFRYCCRQHALDGAAEHWGLCEIRPLTIVIWHQSMPVQYLLEYKYISNRHEHYTLQYFRQQVWRVWGVDCDYAIFSDWRDAQAKIRSGNEPEWYEEKPNAKPDIVLHWAKGDWKKTMFHRLLNIAFYDHHLQRPLDFLWRFVRQTLREQGVWNNDIAREVDFQFSGEFEISPLSLFGDRNSRPISFEHEWFGKGGLQELCDILEGKYWQLRLWRQLPSGKLDFPEMTWMSRVAGFGFPMVKKVLSQQETGDLIIKAFGEGWNGVDLSGALENALQQIGCRS